MPEPGSATRWREPASTLPLRWGSYRTRLLGGAALLVAGGLAVAGGSAASPFAQSLLAMGSVVHVAGWSVLPAAGWRRVWAMIPSTFTAWFLLAGPAWLAILALPYLGWMLVRHRPLASYPTALFVIAAGFLAAQIFGGPYSGMLPALGFVGALMVLSAWAARALHITRFRMRRGRKSRKTQG